MFSLETPVITVGVILDIVIIKVTVVVCVMRDITRDDSVEVFGVVTEIGRRRGWSGWMGGGQRDGDNRGS